MSQTMLYDNHNLEPQDIQAAASQQPMSLLTVDRSMATINRTMPADETQKDLLTLRILEASERKMQLIKQLLSPEEFDSLQIELASKNSSSTDREQRLHREIQRETIKSAQTMNVVNGQSSGSVAVVERRGLSRSEANLSAAAAVNRQSGVISSDVEQKIKENLRRKREAIDFFFQDSTASIATKELAIELRNGHYVDDKTESEAKLLKQGRPQLWNRFVGLMSLFGLSQLLDSGSCRKKTNSELVDEDENKFVSKFLAASQVVKSCPLYLRRNLVTIYARLKADGQLEKIGLPILGPVVPVQNGPQSSRDAARLFRLEDLRCDNMSEAKQAWNEMREKCSRRLLDGTCSIAAKDHHELVGDFSSQKMLLLHPILEYLESLFGEWPKMIQIQPEGEEIKSELKNDLNVRGGAILRVQPSRMSWLELEWMSREEKLSARLVNLYEKSEILRKNLHTAKSSILECLAKFAEDNFEEPEGGSNVRDESLVNLVEHAIGWWQKKLDKLLRIQRELSSGWDELESIRKEQGFRLSLFQLRLIENQVGTTRTENYPPLDQRIIDFSVRSGLEIDILFSKQPLKLFDIIDSQDAGVPADKKRHDRFLTWMRSMELKIIVDEKYYTTWKLYNLLVSQHSANSNCFDVALRTNPLSVYSSLIGRKFVSLDCELYCARNLIGTRKLFAKGRARIKATNTSRDISHRIKMFAVAAEEKNGQQEVCCIEMRCSLQNTGSKQQQMIEFLYDKLFDYPVGLPTPMKCHQLLNKIDIDLLSAVLDNHQHTKSKPHLILNPFTDQLRDPFEDNSKFRRLLLAWRWINSGHHQIDSSPQPQVYLSDLENENAFKVNEFKTRSSKLSKKIETDGLGDQPQLDQQQSRSSGFKRIEQIRAEAGEYLKNYESLLRKKLRLQADLKNRANHRKESMKPLLVEPNLNLHNLKLPDWPRLVFNVRRLIPRPRTARRRPLMPQRRQASTRLAEIISQELMLSGSTSQQHQTKAAGNAPAGDLESRVVSHWHKFASLQRRQTGESREPMQLLVTIQQANNLPMRIVMQQQPRATTRPNSPFSPMGARSPTPIQQPFLQNQQQIFQLVTPTSYVEVIFQQKQQATSLAQGKSPSWNETLFFQIDDQQQQQQQASGQLVDEYLELNLYDYFLSLVDDDPPMMADDSASTLQLVNSSTIDHHLQYPGSAQRSVLARSHQSSRLERHLLGSLRVPLSTLLHNGRIEGSFCFNQPLFLDNHQFEASSIDCDNNNSSTASFQVARPNLTYINLFITLNPPIALAQVNFYLPTGNHETDHVLKYAKLWEQLLSRLWSANNAPVKSGNSRQRRAITSQASRIGFDRVAGRHVRALVLHKGARYCLVSRLLSPLKPPDVLLFEKTPNIDEQQTDNGSRPRQRSEQAIIAALCRFVSLMRPLKHEFLTMKSLASSIWFDSKQLVEQWLGGDSGEEKAALLCNYLLYLGHCSALLLGDSIPDGRCVYVILWREQTRFFEQQGDDNQETTADPVTRENFLSRLPIVLNWRSVQLININEGKIYSLGDRTLPLTSVGSIVTLENVYANIQSRDSPWPANEISFDIRVRSNWLPLFDNLAGGQSSTSHQQLMRLLRSHKHLLRNQSAQLVGDLESLRRVIGESQRFADLQALVGDPMALEPGYKQVFSPDECLQLEQELGKTIKAHLLKWRPTRPTYFNRTLSRLLADKLISFEDDCLQCGQDQTLSTTDSWRSKLAELIRSEILLVQSMSSISSSSSSSGGGSGKQVFSWPVNMPFTSMKSIMNSLFASGVHAADMMSMVDVDQGTEWNLANTSTQFLVACHVRAYPARILSVWLYVGAIVTNRRRGRPLGI